jgi:hypothetical protein
LKKRILKLLGISETAFWLAVAALASWIGVIVASGAGWNPWPAQWDFTNSGAFGDSFGPLSALMASIAAIGAILAFRAQSNEIARLQRRQSKEDKERDVLERLARSREDERDRRTQKTVFEGTFFNLLDTFSKIVAQVDIRTAQGQHKSAQDAFHSILYHFENSVNSASGNKQFAWSSTINKYRNDLNHYFRFMYHLVKYVDSSDVSEKYFYVRLLRSMLSESEIILLGLNCEYGEGSEKFRPLVEKYSMLHNISEAGRTRWFEESAIDASAFNSAVAS